MATAQDYGVTFGYGQWDGVYYTSARPHRGNDRPTPHGTPIVIGDTTIGLTGATGLVSGPHLHTQAGTDEWAQSTINPTQYEFKPGTVVKTGTASQWGNYVCVRVGNVNVYYCHLHKINVGVGAVIKANTTGGTSVDTVKSMYWRLLGREADPGGLQHSLNNVNNRGWEFVYNDLKNSAEGQRDWDWRNPTRVRALEQQLADTKVALQNAQNKPPIEVIKEVEKIVEVPVGGIDQATKDQIAETNSIVKTIKQIIERIFR